jgi:uncharacterized protein (DUF433 family)
MTLDQAIWSDKGRMSGQLCFKGTRIPVSTLFDYAKANELQDFYIDFPDVTPEMAWIVLETSQKQLVSFLQDSPAA